MTTTSDPDSTGSIEPIDPARQLRTQHAVNRWRTTVPARFAESWRTDVDAPVREWVRTLIHGALATPSGRLETGPSLLLVGGTGPGKTHAAWWALAHLASAGVLTSWEVTNAVSMYASLRPQPGVNTEDQFRRYAKTPLLVIDDYGAHGVTQFTREVDYRLINARYEDMRPVLLTSNLPPRWVEGMPDTALTLTGKTGDPTKPGVMDDRISSRLYEMGKTANLGVFDRRRGETP